MIFLKYKSDCVHCHSVTRFVNNLRFAWNQIILSLFNLFRHRQISRSLVTGLDVCIRKWCVNSKATKIAKNNKEKTTRNIQQLQILIVLESTLFSYFQICGVAFLTLAKSRTRREDEKSYTKGKLFFKKIGWGSSGTSALNFFLDHFFLILHDIKFYTLKSDFVKLSHYYSIDHFLLSD